MENLHADGAFLYFVQGTFQVGVDHITQQRLAALAVPQMGTCEKALQLSVDRGRIGRRARTWVRLGNLPHM